MSRPFILSAGLADSRLGDPDWAAAALALAEQAWFDLIVLGRPGAVPFDPLVLAAWAMPLTSGIGVIACVPTPLSHPFHVARALSAIDFLGAGRSGWCPLPGGAPDGKCEDMIAAARSLWDGWQPDTLIIDKASGHYLDSSKVRASNHQGPFFRVAGPLNAMRPPQGHPLLIVDSDDPFAAADADIALVREPGPVAAQQRLLKTPIAANPAELGRLFDAGEIDGVHFEIVNPAAEFPELAQLLAPLVTPRAPPATLRERLSIPAPAQQQERAA